ncbi:phospholipase D family protein [Noviherbaspirillum sp. UKPF54]|uniref:phospholipase D family nuclease n=1 Tax=Noviherbaspirillum sp. UKPF54 TaxID=2601898 RepID=UPI0011B18A39|nr:phospholipase D family protein [Noviherbaspirillum sp. UKPF54]QDZ26986.1 phospholipase D family protein [Noviherbaspirillum sp. UKPF54]
MIVRSRAVFGALALSAALGAHAADAPIAAHGTLQAAFAPWDNVEELVTETIRDARRQVLVQAYLLTSKAIAATLVEACRRGLDVRVMLDAQQLAKTGASAASELAACGIPVWLETRYQNAHNKVIVIDADTPEATVVTGSFNFTWTAQHKNAENILIIRKNPALAGRYAANWERHRQEATPYQK